MARLRLAPEVMDDFERILDHLVDHGVPDAAQRIQAIVAALDILRDHPRIGRPLQEHAGFRELLIGEGARAYAAAYRWDGALDTVLVLAIKAQAERSYRR
jgi:toxin ParE1/3/4